jgi:hypothetical protein
MNAKWAIVISVVVILFVILLVTVLVFTSAFKSKMNPSVEGIFTFQSFDSVYVAPENPLEIPRVLFRTSEDSLPKTHQLIKNVLQQIRFDNPTYKIVYFDRKDRERFIKKYYPQYLPDYDVLIPGTYKADMFRLLVVHHYGGIYNDMGFTYFKPIHTFVKPEDEFVSATENRRPGLVSGFMAAYPRHPLIQHIIDFVVDMIRKRGMGACPLDVTGPRRMGAAYRDYMGENHLNDEYIWPGEHVKKGHKIRLHVLDDTPPNDDTATIDDADGNPILRRKFEGYNKAVYKGKMSGYYAKLYEAGNIYKDRKGVKKT